MKNSKQPAKPSGEECDYMHPEDCEEQSKDDLTETKKSVQEKADEFIEDENESVENES